jgi:hypothetical protein
MSYAGQDAEIKFYNSADELLDTYNWYETLGIQIAGTYIDFSLSDITITTEPSRPPLQGQAVKMEILIPQTYGTLPAIYLDYMNETTVITQNYYRENRTYYFLYDAYPQPALYIDIDIPYNTSTITLDLTDIDYELVHDDIYYSYLKVYDELKFFRDSFSLIHYVTLDQNIIKIDIPYLTENYAINDLTRYVLKLYLAEPIPFYNIRMANTNFTSTSNADEVITMNYYSEGEVIQSINVVVGSVPASFYPEAPDGFAFQNWVFTDGSILAGGQTIETDDIIGGNRVNVFAYYGIDSVIGDNTGVTPIASNSDRLTSILEPLGMATSTGYILMFLITIIAVSVGLSLMKVPLFVTATGDLLILVMFTIWGVLPTYVSVTGYVVLALAIVISFELKPNGESE